MHKNYIGSIITVAAVIVVLLVLCVLFACAPPAAVSFVTGRVWP